MHYAPSVSFPVGRSSLEGALVALLGLAGLVNVLLWQALAQPSALQVSLALALCLLCSVLGAARWWQSPRGRLRWGKGLWTWQASPAVVGERSLDAVRVTLDLQSVLLVRLTASPPSPRWVWLARRDDPLQWHALRRALHARQPRGSLGTVGTPGGVAP